MPNFFCEHCGTEVPRQALSCPKCQRLFASVKCPKCGFSGDEKHFDKGCPVCGYSSPKISETSPSQQAFQQPAVTPAEEYTGGLPIWVYIASAASLIIMVVLALWLLR